MLISFEKFLFVINVRMQQVKNNKQFLLIPLKQQFHICKHVIVIRLNRFNHLLKNSKNVSRVQIHFNLLAIKLDAKYLKQKNFIQFFCLSRIFK